MNDFEGIKLSEISSNVEDLTVRDFLYLYETEGLSREQWEGLSPKERLGALQTLECKLAEIQGRDPVAITAEIIPGRNGHYDPGTRTITLNAECLAHSPRLNLIDTIAHEGRHAYQHYAIEHPGFHRNQKEVDAWRENMKPGNYDNGKRDGLLAYRFQPIEDDAWRYGHLVKDAFTFADMDAANRKA